LNHDVLHIDAPAFPTHSPVKAVVGTLPQYRLAADQTVQKRTPGIQNNHD
jgi:hypothetical protein